MASLLDLPSTRFTYPPVKLWAQGWAARNGCASEPEPIPSQGDVRGIRYTACEDGAEVILYTIMGGGHTWPGGPRIYVGRTSQDIHASTAMWNFFHRHPIPSPPSRP
jgi:polyhydroxybutyrate depolymerase